MQHLLEKIQTYQIKKKKKKVNSKQKNMTKSIENTSGKADLTHLKMSFSGFWVKPKADTRLQTKISLKQKQKLFQCSFLSWSMHTTFF